MEKDLGLPEMISVKSSNVDKVGYDTDNKLMYVKYKDRTRKNGDKVIGKTYRYNGVEHEKYLEMIASDSIGSYLSKNVKDQSGITCKEVGFS